MISTPVRQEVFQRLRLAETEHQSKVLLAIESGSRAWGFASPNSDYDARFIYVHTPEWYLAIGLEEKRDVIEYPIVDDMDVNGWDLRKALRLFSKSNPGFVEWIQSPIIYEHAGTFHNRALELLPQVYSVKSGIYHYRSMAKTDYRSHLTSDLVPLKKYFYALRALLSVRWLEHYQTPAPIELHRLMEFVAGEEGLESAINDLLAVKRESPEMGLSPQIVPIQKFVERELDRLENINPDRTDRVDIEPLLSDLFRTILKETWG